MTTDELVGHDHASDDAMAAAGRCFAEGYAVLDDPAVPVTEAARLAYTPTGPSLAELERRIQERRDQACAAGRSPLS